MSVRQFDQLQKWTGIKPRICIYIRRVLVSLATSLDTIASAKRIKRQINLLPGTLYLPLKCKSAAIRLAHSVAVSNKMFSRIKMSRPTGRGDSPERSRTVHRGDKRRETIGLENNSMKLMEILLRNFQKFSRIFEIFRKSNYLIHYCNYNKIIVYYICVIFTTDNGLENFKEFYLH